VQNITLADKTIFVFCLGLVLMSYVLIWPESSYGTNIVLMVNGEKKYVLDSHDEKEIVIHGKIGKSMIEVADGSARFVKSPCTSKQCIHSGWLSHNFNLLACVPNGISVAYSRSKTQYDAINF